MEILPKNKKESMKKDKRPKDYFNPMLRRVGIINYPFQQTKDEDHLEGSDYNRVMKLITVKRSMLLVFKNPITGKADWSKSKVVYFCTSRLFPNAGHIKTEADYDNAQFAFDADSFTVREDEFGELFVEVVEMRKKRSKIIVPSNLQKN